MFLYIFFGQLPTGMYENRAFVFFYYQKSACSNFNSKKTENNDLYRSEFDNGDKQMYTNI